MSIFNLETWLGMLEDDFNRGFVAALVFVVALFVIFLLVRLWIRFAFRRRCVSSVTIHMGRGDIMISASAIEAAVQKLISNHPQLTLQGMRIYRDGGDYEFVLKCNFVQDSVIGLPELTDAIKTELRDRMQKLYGIKSVNKIRFDVSKFKGRAGNGQPVPVIAKN